MQTFVCLMLLVIFVSGVVAYCTDNETFIGLQFLAMMTMIVGVPLLSILV